MRNWLVPLVLASGLLATAPASAQVARGPYPNTATSQGGSLIWYVGAINLEGRRFGELDAICAGVPVPQVTGWRAPTKNEVLTLTRFEVGMNSVATWSEIYFANESALWPAIPPFEPQSRRNVRIKVLVRDLTTYEGARTTLSQVVPGQMYQRFWFDRWTRSFLTYERSILSNPAQYSLGRQDRLLCVAPYGAGR